MADENAKKDNANSQSILVVDETTGETKRLESKEIGGKTHLLAVLPVLGTAGAKDTDYKVSLVANTATQIPEADNVPDYDYVLVLGNRSDTNMVWGNSAGIIVTGAIDKGILLAKTNGAMNIKLNASETIYVACSAEKDLNYTIFKITN